MEAQMKVNGELVRTLRERKSWSQEHLADAAGLSVRTVQRVEVDNIASAETRLALAAALGVPVGELIPGPPEASARAGSGLARKMLVGVGVAFALAFGLIILLNALSGFLPRQP